ncbi:MAG: hypothetical protein ACRCS3_14225 [Paracoccaceae bacterium]
MTLSIQFCRIWGSGGDDAKQGGTRGRNALTDGDPRKCDGTEGVNLRGIWMAITLVRGWSQERLGRGKIGSCQFQRFFMFIKYLNEFHF